MLFMDTKCKSCGKSHPIGQCQGNDKDVTIADLLRPPMGGSLDRTFTYAEVDAALREVLDKHIHETKVENTSPPPSKKRGRPKADTDRKAYRAEFMRKKRAADKAEREGKKT